MTRLLLLALALVAAPVGAQQTPAQTPPQTPQPPAQERRPLNLQLDNPSSFATTAPADKEPAKGLPALGEDARRIAPPKREGSAPTPGGPFPKDTNPQL